MSAIVGFGFGSSPGRRASIGVVVACGIVVASLLAGLVLGVLGARFGPTVVVGLPLAGFWLAAALARPVWAIVPVMLVLPVSLGAGDVGPLALLDVAVLGAVGLTTVVALSRPASLRLALPPGLLWGGAVCALGVPALALAVDTERGDAPLPHDRPRVPLRRGRGRGVHAPARRPPPRGDVPRRRGRHVRRVAQWRFRGRVELRRCGGRLPADRVLRPAQRAGLLRRDGADGRARRGAPRDCPPSTGSERS